MLSGLRILDLSRLLPGPFCTLYLAQLGAEVIKIEEPGTGDYSRAMSADMFSAINRGKKSVTLDLRKPEGAAALRRLARTADVVLDSFRPGVMDKLGCGYETLKQENPKLVFAALTGYGHNGPYRDRPGHDMNYCGYAGALDQIGAAGGPPVLSNTQIADLAGGALTCALALLAAVFQARATGRGSFVDVAMLDGTLALQAVALGTLRTLGQTNPRGTDMLTGGLANYRLYECADGKWFALGALEFKFWAEFCRLAGREDLAKKKLTDPATHAETAALFRTRTRADWEKLLADEDTCGGPILTLAEALEDPQVRARGMVQDDGGKPAFAFPAHFDGAPPAPLPAAPALGRDTAAVLTAAGFSESELAALRAARATST